MKPVIRSYKKVIHFVNASFSAGFQTENIAIAKDASTNKQTSATDTDVPTGNVIKFIESQIAISNVVGVPCYINCTLQYILGGQSFIDPNTVGGSNQRNQVLHMSLYSIGQFQNSNHTFKVKIPKRFQRMREGMQWGLVWRTSASVNRESQHIYKFYS